MSDVDGAHTHVGGDGASNAFDDYDETDGHTHNGATGNNDAHDCDDGTANARS